MAITTITCPTSCEDLSALPVITTDLCTPTIKSSEITDIYFSLQAAVDFTDAEDPTEWADRLSQDGGLPTGSTFTTTDLIRHVFTIADMPAPTTTKIDVSGGRSVETNVKRQINIDVDDANDDIYNWVRKTECGNFAVKLWFKTKGGVGFGGNTGIEGTLLLHPVLARGGDSIEKYIGTFEWTDPISPDRFAIPV